MIVKCDEMLIVQTVAVPLMFILLTSDLVSGLRCPPCAKIHCATGKLSPSGCKGGVTTSICGCCPVCARVQGESCGGEYDYLGKCDKGLYCQPLKHKSYKVLYLGRTELVGSCTKLPSPQADEGRSLFCRPECSPVFCKRNPRAICSATNVALANQECQGRCQHTSCSACKYLNEDQCPKCRADDFRCLKKYGKCKKREYCSRKKFPCKKKRYKMVEEGKFVCNVPECLT